MRKTSEKVVQKRIVAKIFDFNNMSIPTNEEIAYGLKAIRLVEKSKWHINIKEDMIQRVIDTILYTYEKALQILNAIFNILLTIIFSKYNYKKFNIKYYYFKLDENDELDCFRYYYWQWYRREHNLLVPIYFKKKT